IAGFLLLLTVVQVVYGTEVREAIDHLNYEGVSRQDWISSIGASYDIHRMLAYISLGATVLLFFLFKNKFSSLTLHSRYAWIILILGVVQMVSGIILSRFTVPAVGQTTHLVFARLFFGAQSHLKLLMTKSKPEYEQSHRQLSF